MGSNCSGRCGGTGVGTADRRGAALRHSPNVSAYWLSPWRPLTIKPTNSRPGLLPAARQSGRLHPEGPADSHICEGFSHFVTSMTAPVASGWSGCRVGLAPTGKRRFVTAHTSSGHCVSSCGCRLRAENVLCNIAAQYCRAYGGLAPASVNQPSRKGSRKRARACQDERRAREHLIKSVYSAGACNHRLGYRFVQTRR